MGFFHVGRQLYYLWLGLPSINIFRLCMNFLGFAYLISTFMDVAFVGVGRGLVFLQILKKHFGCL